MRLGQGIQLSHVHLRTQRSNNMTASSNGLPFHPRHLEEGQRYIKYGKTISPCPPSTNHDNLPTHQDIITVLRKQMGKIVLDYDSAFVIKSGFAVERNEVEAMNLVSTHTSIPSPKVISRKIGPGNGIIDMTLMPGSSLERKWDEMDEETKESVCRQLWTMISQIRDIPRPPELVDGPFQCMVDGSPTTSPLLEDLDPDSPQPLMSDSDVRDHICQHYLHFGGRLYKDQLPDMLPRADCSVFTHGDIAPRNIMVDEEGNVTGIVDWESAGWYLDYWECAQIMRPAVKCTDWSAWMEKTAQRKWDVRGINAERKVLF